MWCSCPCGLALLGLGPGVVVPALLAAFFCVEFSVWALQSPVWFCLCLQPVFWGTLLPPLPLAVAAAKEFEHVVSGTESRLLSERVAGSQFVPEPGGQEPLNMTGAVFGLAAGSHFVF